MPYEISPENSMSFLNGLLLRKKQEEDEAKQTLNQLMTPQQQPAEQPVPTEQSAPLEQPEQRGGTAMVNSFMENAFRPAPNPYAIGLQRGVTVQKQAYGDAQDDAGRQMAASTAELLRNKAAAAGIDMSGYGSDVSYNDAYNNLASREAQDIMEALQGRYAMGSDQYYERQYEKARWSGLSVNQAKRLAGAQAREYQANRVAYLQGAYNSYGHDGRVTNDYGNMFLGMMAQENPTLANFYAQVYPNQKEAYIRDNQIEDKVLDQTHLLERLQTVFNHDITKMGVSDYYNTHQQMVGGEIARQNAGFNSALELREIVFRNNIELQNKLDEARAKSNEDEQAFLRKAQTGHQLATVLGFKPGTPEYQATIAKSVGLDLPKSMGGFNDKLVTAGNATIKQYQEMIAGIREQLADPKLSKEDRAGLQQQMELLTNATYQIANKLANQYGVNVEPPSLAPFTNNPDLDLPTIKAILSTAPPKTTRDAKLQIIVNWVHESPSGKEIPEAIIEKYLVDSGLLPPAKGNRSKSTFQYDPEKAEEAQKAYSQSRQFDSAQYLQPRQYWGAQR